MIPIPNITPSCTHPYLQFYTFLVTVNRFDFEVNADRADESRRERVVGVPEQEAGFSHTAVPNNEELEHVVKILIGHILLDLRLLTSIVGRCHLGWREKTK